jgi:hypothetical protein
MIGTAIGCAAIDVDMFYRNRLGAHADRVKPVQDNDKRTSEVAY